MQDNAQIEAQQQIQMLRESAADFVTRNTDMRRLRERRGTLPGHDPALIRQIADLGWLGIAVPEEHGGLGLGFAELAVVVEELGKGLIGGPVVGSVFGALALRHGMNEALKSRLLPQFADGSLLPAVAWQEGAGGTDPSKIDMRAEKAGSGFVLSGSKRFVDGASSAGGFVVSARGAGGPALYWVGADSAGLTLQHEWRADGTPSGWLVLDGVRVEEDEVVTTAGPDGLAPLARAFDEAVVMAAAEMLGVMEAALQMALAYMRTRVQFGKPIGSFQALQHKAADLYVQQELTRAVLQDAVRAIDSACVGPERAGIASRCKARASDAGLRVTREVIQLHGAIGYTDEYDAGLYLKRALVLSAWLGNGSQHRRRFAALGGEGLGV